MTGAVKPAQERRGRCCRPPAMEEAMRGYHAVEFMRLMIGQIAEVVKASHFWDRFAMRVPRMREELRAHHDGFLEEIREALLPQHGTP